MTPLPPGLAADDALSLHDDVASRLVFAGAQAGPPLVTIAIPTFRRPDLLIEAVESALRQEFDRPMEIIVIDNDPDSNGCDALLAALPALRDRTFRYYVNARNVGMYPNHNRAIRLARGEWVSILNDDDLLLPHFLRTIFGVLDRRPGIKAIGARKQRIDQREVAALTKPHLFHIVAYHAVTGLDSHGRPYRRVRPRKFFWGSPMDNMAGFIARRDVLEAVGGFPPADEWSADTWLFIRIAASFGLYQLRERLAIVRVRRNESMKPEVLMSFMRQGARIRRTLAETVLPRWYARFEPLALARERALTVDYWKVDLPEDAVGRDGHGPPARSADPLPLAQADDGGVLIAAPWAAARSRGRLDSQIATRTSTSVASRAMPAPAAPCV